MSRRLIALLACLLLCVTLSSRADAQPAATALQPAATAPQPAPPPPPGLVEAAAPPARNWALTMSPIHLVMPVLEITAERRLAAKVGVAAMLGAGEITASSGVVENTFTVFELGLSARYYVLGSFNKGLQVGGAVEWLTVKGDDVNGSMLSGVGNGVLVAPFIGYKHTFSWGFTFDGQLGTAFTAIRAEADNGAMAEESNTSVYLNLNLGWSF